MHKSDVGKLRDRIPAAVAVALLHLAFFIVLINAMRIKAPIPPAEHETIMILVASAPIPHAGQKKPSRPAAATAPIYRFYTYTPNAIYEGQTGETGGTGLSIALNDCAPEKLSTLDAKKREICRKLGAVAKYDPKVLIIPKSDVKYYERWKAEKEGRNAAYLAPCASPHGFDVLYTLRCLKDLATKGYDKDRMQHYQGEE